MTNLNQSQEAKLLQIINDYALKCVYFDGDYYFVGMDVVKVSGKSESSFRKLASNSKNTLNFRQLLGEDFRNFKTAWAIKYPSECDRFKKSKRLGVCNAGGVLDFLRLDSDNPWLLPVPQAHPKASTAVTTHLVVKEVSTKEARAIACVERSVMGAEPKFDFLEKELQDLLIEVCIRGGLPLQKEVGFRSTYSEKGIFIDLLINRKDEVLIVELKRDSVTLENLIEKTSGNDRIEGRFYLESVAAAFPKKNVHLLFSSPGGISSWANLYLHEYKPINENQQGKISYMFFQDLFGQLLKEALSNVHHPSVSWALKKPLRRFACLLRYEDRKLLLEEPG